MNFDLRSVAGDDLPELPYDEKDVNSWFSKQKSNVIGHMLTLKGLLIFSNISNVSLIPSEEFCRRFVTLIPRQHPTLFPSKILIFFAIIPIIILIMLYLLYKVNKEDKNLLQSIQLILGQSIRFNFRKISSIAMFFTILIVYTLLSNDIYSIFINSGHYKVELKIDNVADLAKSELPIRTSEIISLIYSNNSDETFKIIDQKIKWIPDCVEKLVHLRNIICIVDQIDGNIAVEKYRDSDGSPIMYVADSCSNCDVFFYVFEPGSPYVERFISVMRRIHESGIKRISMNAYFGNKTQNEGFEISQTVVENISAKLWMLTLFGSFTASFAFIIESLMTKMNK